MCRHAIILCGGKGTRFASISEDPKVMAPFRGEPFLNWLLSYLARNDFDEITLSIGYRQEVIKKFLKDHKFKFRLNFLSEELPLGTGGAIKLFFKKFDINEVYVFNGDTFFSEDLPEDFLMRNQNKITCLCKRVDVNDRFGSFLTSNDGYKIVRGTIDNPILNSNVYCGVARIIKSVQWTSLVEPFSVEDLFSTQLQDLSIVNYTGDFLDFGIPDDYHRLQKK